MKNGSVIKFLTTYLKFSQFSWKVIINNHFKVETNETFATG